MSLNQHHEMLLSEFCFQSLNNAWIAESAETSPAKKVTKRKRRVREKTDRVIESNFSHIEILQLLACFTR